MKIAFFGNSHTYFNYMPHTVGLLFGAYSGFTPDITMFTQGGMTLGWHSEQISTAFNLKYSGYDYVVLQDVAHPFIGKKALMDDLDRILPMIPEESKPCLYMTWASKAAPEVQAEMDEAYSEGASVHGTLLAPVGRVWKAVREKHEDVNLFWNDGEHASPYGSYLAACVIYCVLTDRKEALPAPCECVCGELGLEANLCAEIHAEVNGVLNLH